MGSFFSVRKKYWPLCLLLVIAIWGDSHRACVLAGDWPQILGPNRNGIASDERISLDWPASGPTLLWQKPVGAGVAGVSVQGDLAVLFHRIDDSEIVIGLDATTGQQKWTQSFPATFQARIMPDDGPLCPAVLGKDYVLLHGAGGHLHCLEPATGKLRWSVDTHAQFGADEGYFGAGSSPLVVDQLVLLNVGGARQEAGVVAFDLKTGAVRWKTGAWQASYSSPVLTKVDSQPLAVFVTRLETVGLEPATGKVHFRHPFGMRGPTVNGANPVIPLPGHLFLTSSYGIGNLWAKISAEKLEVIREDLKPMASQYTTPIVVRKEKIGIDVDFETGKPAPSALGHMLIGIDGRQDGGPVDLVCCDPATGEDCWRVPEFGYATLILAGQHLLIMKTDGELVIAAADAEQYKELQRVPLSNRTCRALPALANGKLYLRDEQFVKCFDLTGH